MRIVKLMSKIIKLPFAIGKILIAVIIIYLFIVGFTIYHNKDNLHFDKVSFKNIFDYKYQYDTIKDYLQEKFGWGEQEPQPVVNNTPPQPEIDMTF